MELATELFRGFPFNLFSCSIFKASSIAVWCSYFRQATVMEPRSFILFNIARLIVLEPT